MKFIIGKPIIEIAQGKAKMTANICYGEKRWDIYYELEEALKQAFTADRADGFLVSVLPMAMMCAREDANLEIICESPVSKKLYHQLVSYYIPTVCKNISYYQPVKIAAETIDEKLDSAGAVGTGISGGVDSSYTIAKYMDPEKGMYKLTHGVFFNIGIYGGFDSDSEKMLEEKARKIAEDTGIQYICIKSNACLALYEKAHAPIVPFIFMGAILCFQKLFSVYYFSSGYCAEEFCFSDADAALFDWMNTQYFSTESTQFFSSGLERTRLEKVKYIVDYPFTYQNLSVCLTEDQHRGNCGRCAKCTRTMAELECAGALERYEDVFDLDDFYQNPAYHWGYILLKAWGGDPFCTDILNDYRKSGRKLPAKAYWGAVQKWVKRGFTTVNRKREKIENRK